MPGIGDQVSGLLDQMAGIRDQVPGMPDQMAGIGDQVTGMADQMVGIGDQVRPESVIRSVRNTQTIERMCRKRRTRPPEQSSAVTRNIETRLPEATKRSDHHTSLHPLPADQEYYQLAMIPYVTQRRWTAKSHE
jgi:hypothetical protein